VIFQSMQEMNVSGEPPQAPRGLQLEPHSDAEKGFVLYPLLLKSLHEFPVFQSHRPTAVPLGHVNQEGTWSHHSRYSV